MRYPNHICSSRIFLFLVGGMCLAVLAGCSSNEKSSQKEDASQRASEILNVEAMKYPMKDPRFQELRKTLLAMGDEALQPSIAAMDSKQNPTVNLAIHTLADMGEAGRPALIKATTSSNPYLRRLAIKLLCQDDDPQALPALLKLLKGMNVASNIKEAILKFGPAAVPGLLQRMASSEQRVCLPALELLGKMGEERAIQPAMGLLKEKDFIVRSKASEVLASFGAKAVIPLKAALKNAEKDSEKNRRTIVTTLTRTGDPRVPKILADELGKTNDFFWNNFLGDALVRIGPASVDVLLPLLKEKNKQRVKAAMTALQRIPDGRIVQPLLEAQVRLGYSPFSVEDQLAKQPKIVEQPAIELLNSDASPEVRELVVRLLWKIKSRRAVKPLCEILRHRAKDFKEYQNVQRSAVWALGAIGDPSVIPVLKTVLDWPSSDLTKTAVMKSLGKLNAQDMIPRFIQEVENPRNWGSQSDKGRAAIESLGYLKAKQAVPAIKQRLEKVRSDAGFQTADTCIGALKRIGGPESLAILETAGKSKISAVRDRAIDALVTFASPSSIPTLQAAAKYNDTMTGVNSVAVCRTLDVPEALALLRQWAVKGDRHVREKAMAVIMEKDPKAIDFMIQRFPKEPDGNLQGKIIKLLGDSKSPELMPFFLSVAKDVSPEARQARGAAFKALAKIGDAKMVPLLETYVAETKATKERTKDTIDTLVFGGAVNALDSLKSRLKREQKAREKAAASQPTSRPSSQPS